MLGMGRGSLLWTKPSILWVINGYAFEAAQVHAKYENDDASMLGAEMFRPTALVLVLESRAECPPICTSGTRPGGGRLYSNHTRDYYYPTRRQALSFRLFSPANQGWAKG